MARVTLDHLVKVYGTNRVVDDVSLVVEQGELVALLGPSGCGKTTTLRMIAGFVEATSGSVKIGEEDVTDLPPYRRNTGMVFQGYALFPHMTVAGNVAFGLEMRKVPKSEIDTRVKRALELVRLGQLAERYPRQLSGGQQQRVALARALVVEPEVFLLDEPLSNLDAKLRSEVRVEIRQLQRELGLTTIFVTHDQEEALTLADRLVVMSQGVIQQIGTPTELYERPANAFVADFIGKSNFLKGRLGADGRFVTEGGLELKTADGNASSTLLAIRPEKIALGSAAMGLDNRLQGTVDLVTYLGSLTEYRVRVSPTETVTVSTPNVDRTEILATQGQTVVLGWRAEAGLLLAEPAGR
ncbi:MAG: ABC transporter ATP-binding protein [Alphaproteobacteria bacterium]|nr:ABC transporter ATP-binding protein [Alphaproteobacteria bacterium]